MEELPSSPTALSGGTDRHRSCERSVTLPICIGTESITAIPDTGSDENAISSAYAKKIGLHVQTHADSPASFQLANGRFIQSSGIASATCSFRKGLNKQSGTAIFFNVFPELAVPVIIGRAFLQATETLTRHIDRLDISIHQRPPSVPPRILHLNHPVQRLRCYLNVNLVYANADTGAEMNLVSPEFAAQRGFQIEKPDAQHRESYTCRWQPRCHIWAIPRTLRHVRPTLERYAPTTGTREILLCSRWPNNGCTSLQ